MPMFLPNAAQPFRTTSKAPEQRLLRAAENADLAGVRAALAKGASIEITDRRGWTPLHLALWNHRKPDALLVIEHLLDAGANVSQALFKVIDNLALVKRLIEAGANANEQDNRGQTPLFYTAEPEVMALLLRSGANPNHLGPQTRSPLTSGLLPLMFGKTGGNPVADANRVRIVSLLLNHGANPNLIDREGRSPLSEALKNRADVEVVKLLVEAGARMDLVVPNGQVSPQDLLSQVQDLAVLAYFDHRELCAFAKDHLDENVSAKPARARL